MSYAKPVPLNSPNNPKPQQRIYKTEPGPASVPNQDSHSLLVRGVHPLIREYIKSTAPIVGESMNDWITQALKDRVERQLAQPEVTEALRAQRVAREMITKEFSQLHQTDVLEHIKELGYSQPQQG